MLFVATQMGADPTNTSLPELYEEDINRSLFLLPASDWRELSSHRIFITGGTGFVGKWLIATLLNAKKKLDFKCQITVLSRDPNAFMREMPMLAQQIQLVNGDVRDFQFPSGEFDCIIHAATDVATTGTPQEIFSTCVEGTKRILDFARQCHAKNLLLVSSGAVYGSLPIGMTRVPETYIWEFNPLDAPSAYGKGKRESEWLVANSNIGGLQVKIARLFALVGPYLPLNKQFAIGNFIDAAMVDRDITIHGDGSPYRSYLYAADMAAWLWGILIKGDSGEIYNVGSEESVAISKLAETVVDVLKKKINIKTLKLPLAGSAAEYYVPDTNKIRASLGLKEPMGLRDAIERTYNWHIMSKL